MYTRAGLVLLTAPPAGAAAGSQEVGMPGPTSLTARSLIKAAVYKPCP